MKKNEENLEVVDVEFTPDISKETLVGANTAIENGESPRQKQLLGERVIIANKEVLEGKEISEDKEALEHKEVSEDKEVLEYKEVLEGKEALKEESVLTQNETLEQQEDNEQSKQRQGNQKEDTLAYQESQTNDERTSRDTSFRSYAKEKISKERIKKRGFLARISRFCLITLVIILAMPMLITGAGVVAGGVVASLGVIVVGLAGVAFTAFLITVQPGLIGWLGAFVSLGLLSGGGLALCLVILLMRGIRYIIRMLRNTETNRDTIAREE